MIRSLFTTVLLVVCFACTNSSGKGISNAVNDAPPASSSSKVLIELFTSQGCSSCPSADKLVGNIIAEDTNVIALSFHVDYWDRLGWKDVFSNHDYTIRQQQYVSALHAESLYTPQAVIQGKYEMVGSNRNNVLNAIGKAKQDAAGQSFTAAATLKGSNIQVTYNFSQAQPKQQMVIALVQNKATTSVGRGENAGAQLTDYNVVRNLIMQPANGSSIINLSLPDGLKKDNASIVLFTQDEQTKSIQNVTELHL